MNRWRFYFLEFERRATTPRRVRTRLGNYRRYFNSGWPNRDHGGLPPLVLFVFPNLDAEEGFLHGVSGSHPPDPVHVQPPDPCRAWGIGRLMATAAASPCRTEAPGATGPGCKMTILRPRDFL